VLQRTREISTAYREAADAMYRAIPLSTDFGERGRADLVGLVHVLQTMRTQFTEVIPNLDAFRSTIEQAPRTTTALNRARNRTVNALSQFRAETESIIQLTEMMERTARETLDKWPEEQAEGR
jgi:hypothetical protein